ncbi:MAG: putative metal-dependent rane protease [Bacteroidetes bacterium]|nr:putative metal-dependent rane protease [Bacteroidota bacterium]
MFINNTVIQVRRGGRDDRSEKYFCFHSNIILQHNPILLILDKILTNTPMENTVQERHSWLKLTVVLLWISVWAAATAFSGNNEVTLNYDDPKTVALMYVLQIVSVIILFVAPAILIAVFWTTTRIRFLGIATKPRFATLIAAGFGILFALPLIDWLSGINQQMHLPSALSGLEEWMKSTEAKAAGMTAVFTRGTTIGSLFLNLFVVAFLAAFSEELFFRGLLQKMAIQCFKNKHVAVWFGAIIFSAFHMQFYGFLPRMLMGAYLGYLFLWSGSLWPGILAHFLNNGIIVFLTWLSNRGAIAIDPDKITGGQNQLAYVAGSVILVTACLYLVQRIEKKRSGSLVQ